MWIAVLGSVNLEAALKGVFNRVLTELWLGVNNIGDDGAKVIVEALKVNAVVTILSFVGNNRMGDAGKKAVQDAVMDRSGFVLEL